jgi:hypothetical protein
MIVRITLFLVRIRFQGGVQKKKAAAGGDDDDDQRDKPKQAGAQRGRPPFCLS